MRTLVALLFLAAAGAFLWWGLCRNPAEPVGGEGTEPTTSSSEPPGPIGAPRAPGALARATPPPSRAGRKGPPADTTIRYGSLRIRLRPVAGLTVGTSLRLDVEPLGAGLSEFPLAVPQEDGAWLYERLPVGTYRLRAFVPGTQDATATATIERDAEGALEMELYAGAEVSYRAVLPTGDALELARIELLDGRGVPMGGSFQGPVGVSYVPAASGRRLAGEGRVVGLKPGAYRLRATSEAGETDERAFQAALGAAAIVELKLRK